MHTKWPVRCLFGCILLVWTAVQCATTQHVQAPDPRTEPPDVAPELLNMSGDELRARIHEYLSERVREYERQPPAGRPQRGGTGGERPSASAARERLAQRGIELIRELRRRAHADILARVEQEFGARAAPQTESIPLEAIDSAGNTVEIPVPVQTRELRRLTLPVNRSRMHAVMSSGELAPALYAGAPAEIVPATSRGFVRRYEGEEASAIAMESKLIVTLKGGEWVDAAGGGNSANAVAVRGLDWSDGLKVNSNQRYDDTMFVVVESPGGEFEVFEYRMTTESSSADRGVGRLDSKQVVYVRGLHRGRDPAYRLKGGSADGTRVEMEGTYQITGANIHSAYARRTITSSTPLPENVSLGCQVVASGKAPFEESLVRVLDEKNVKEFPYTIVDDDEIAFFDETLQEQGAQSLLIHAIARED